MTLLHPVSVSVVSGSEPDPFLTLAKAKEHLRVTHDVEDTLITDLIAEACQSVEGPDGLLNRAIASSSYDIVFERCGLAFDCQMGGLHTLDSVTVETDDGPETVSVNGFVAAPRHNVLTVSKLPDTDWPLARTGHPHPVTLRVSGGAAIGSEPPEVRTLTKLMLAELYERRTENTEWRAGHSAHEHPAIARLINNLKIRRF